MPKWTYNCPPIASFLKKTNLNGKILYLIITYGGFDEKRYAESYKNKISKVCEDVKDVLLVKRDKIEDDEEKVRGWAKNVVENIKKTTNR
jgi:putative NADPH-quinone reductase